jgi:sugar phosphate isomerase/epimerase
MTSGDSSFPRFGWAAPVESAALVRDAGLDYIEPQIVPMRLENDDAFAAAKSAIARLPLPAPVMSYLFPHDFRIVGPQTDARRNRNYFARVVEIVALARTGVVVLGSGWTRNIPEGWSRERAEAEFLRIVEWCADALRPTGAALAIEPLNRKESNLVNRVADSVRLARSLGRADVRAHADFYHMDEESEPLDVLIAAAPWLAHVHLADTGRKNPGTGSYDYPTFFRHLKSAGYRGTLSAECGVVGEPLQAMRDSAAFLRAAWASA